MISGDSYNAFLGVALLGRTRPLLKMHSLESNGFILDASQELREGKLGRAP